MFENNRSLHITSPNNMYGNCHVLSPAGILMFKCNDKKANWYLERDLAQLVNENPKTLKLKFEPKGLGHHDHPYGLSEMANKCVQCGNTETLTKHHVIPFCYRRYFPLNLKSHNFHNVLPLCYECHVNYEKYAFAYKLEFAKIYNAPINGLIYANPESGIKIKRLASCILNIGDRDKIPAKRISEMKTEIRNILNIKRITNKRLEEVLNQKTTICNKTHGEIVVSQLDNINDFIVLWRKHFIEHTDCKFLPENWM